MPWDLEIHHLDVASSGDSTIIVARHPAVHPNPAIERTVLIDAGKAAHSDVVHNYLVALGVAQVDVMVASHYDNDHYSGLHALLSQGGTNLYDNAIIYDPGQPPDASQYFRESVRRDRAGAVTNRNPRSDYLKYLKAINEKPDVVRATMMVNSFEIVRYNAGRNQIPVPGNPAIPVPSDVDVGIDDRYYHGTPDGHGGRNKDLRPVVGQASLLPDWLVGKEIMWGNGGDNTNGRPAFAPGPIVLPANGPSLTCICANKWTQQGGAANSYVSEVSIFNGPDRHSQAEIANLENGFRFDGGGSPNDNAKSLGFILEFNNFRYYIAGDLEEAQEDGHHNNNPTVHPATGPAVFKNGIKQNLNPNNTTPGRVSAIHTSHHGSDTATSRLFLEQMIPSGAFISCSEGNSFRHPAQRTVNVLDGYPEIPDNSTFAVNQHQHPNRPPLPLYKPIVNYLTGFQRPDLGVLYGVTPFEDRTNGGESSYTAGEPVGGTVRGNVLLQVSEDESNCTAEGILYRGVEATLDELSTQLGLGITAAEMARIADYGAIFGGYQGVTQTIGATAQSGTGAMKAAGWVGRDENDASLVETAVAAADHNAAVAAISADARFGLLGVGTAEAVGHAVQGRSMAQISAAATVAITAANLAAGHAVIPGYAADAAGYAGDAVFQHFGGTALGRAAAGFAAAAAIGAIHRDNNTVVEDAVAIGTFVGAAVAAPTTVEIINVVYDAAVSAGMASAPAAVSGAVGAVCFANGEPLEVLLAVSRVMRLAGSSLGDSLTAGGRARSRTDLTQGGNTNDMFRVDFHDDNPVYTGGGGANPRTISHTS